MEEAIQIKAINCSVGFALSSRSCMQLTQGLDY